jgi:glucokinase
VDLGGTNIRAAVVGEGGRLLSTARRKVSDDRTPDAVVGQVVNAIQEVLSQASLELRAAAGVGMGIAAQLRGETGIVAAGPNLGWSEVPVGDMLGTALGRKVKIVNDVEAITWAEVLYGAAQGHRDVLVVIPGTGVGGGMVLDGRLYRGATGVAAEIGHVKVRESGEECGCGKRGCLEAYLGGANLVRRLGREAEQGWTALLEKAGGKLDEIHPGLLEDLVRDGDPRASELFGEIAGYFGAALANAVTLINPSALVLGGTILQGCPTLWTLSEKVLSERVLSVAGEALAILKASLGQDAGVIGAASLTQE